MEQLQEYRRQLDDLDKQIIVLIAERLELCKNIGKYKKQNKIPMMQPERVKIVQESRVLLARQLGISSSLVLSIYNELVAEACKLETEIISGI